MPLFDALPDADYVWPIVSARDLDPLTANLEIQAISFRSCAKHVQDEVRSPEFVAPLLRDDRRRGRGAGRRAAGLLDDQLHHGAAPSHDGPMTEASIALARAGVPIVIMPLPIMGTTGRSRWRQRGRHARRAAPAVVLFQLAAPVCPLTASPTPGAADLRSGSTSPPRPRAGRRRSPAWRWQADLRAADAGRRHRRRRQGADFQERRRRRGGLLSALLGADSLVGSGCLDAAQATSVARRRSS